MSTNVVPFQDRTVHRFLADSLKKESPASFFSTGEAVAFTVDEGTADACTLLVAMRVVVAAAVLMLRAAGSAFTATLRFLVTSGCASIMDDILLRLALSGLL